MAEPNNFNQVFKNFVSSSVSTNNTVTNEALTGYVILGSISISAVSYISAGLWLVVSLDLRRRLSIFQTVLAWGAVVIWGVVSSLVLTVTLAIFIIQILNTARTGVNSGTNTTNTTEVDEQTVNIEYAGSLTPQYVLSIGLSIGVLLNYRNIGRGWIWFERIQIKKKGKCTTQATESPKDPQYYITLNGGKNEISIVLFVFQVISSLVHVAPRVLFFCST